VIVCKTGAEAAQEVQSLQGALNRSQELPNVLPDLLLFLELRLNLGVNLNNSLLLFNFLPNLAFPFLLLPRAKPAAPLQADVLALAVAPRVVLALRLVVAELPAGDWGKK